jgi:hypothetical protein
MVFGVGEMLYGVHAARSAAAAAPLYRGSASCRLPITDSAPDDVCRTQSAVIVA